MTFSKDFATRNLQISGIVYGVIVIILIALVIHTFSSKDKSA